MEDKVKQALLENLPNITWTRGDGLQGIPYSEIQDNFPPKVYLEFLNFMDGQTVRSINNGVLYYVQDVERFLQGRPNLD